MASVQQCFSDRECGGRQGSLTQRIQRGESRNQKRYPERNDSDGLNSNVEHSKRKTGEAFQKILFSDSFEFNPSADRS